MRAILRAHHGEFGGFRNQIVGQGTGFSGGDQIVGNGFNQFTKRFRTPVHARTQKSPTSRLGAIVIVRRRERFGKPVI